MTRRRLLVLLGFVALAAIVGAVVLLAQDDNDDERPAAVTSELLEPPVRVQDERDEALALIRMGQARTVHARYEAVGDTTGALPRTVEVWRRDGESRTDTAYAAEGQVAESVSIRRAGGAIACQRAGDGPWSCEQLEAVPEDLFEQAAADLTEADLAARDAEVRGRSARCFTVETDDVIELCFDAGGVLLRLAVDGGALELVSLDDDVAADVLEPPVQPGA